jgi:hypothetical protein
VYKPVLEIVPQETPLHPVPEMLQFTDVFVLPVSVAENCCCPPVDTCAVAGDTETETDATLWMTTLAEEDFVGSATEVAVTVAREGLGIVAGAVYKPDAVTVPHEPETQPIPETVQLTAVLDAPVTFAVNCC